MVPLSHRTLTVGFRTAAAANPNYAFNDQSVQVAFENFQVNAGEFSCLPPGQQLASLGPASLWIGLKNSDDQGTAFDLQAEVAIDSVLVATARTLCIGGVTRNPDKAKEAVIQFGPFDPVSVAPDAVFSLTLRTRIGTNPDGTKCAGHSNAVGLRLYYDGSNRTKVRKVSHNLSMISDINEL